MSNLSDVANISIIATCILAYLAFGRMCAKASLGDGEHFSDHPWRYRALYLVIMFFWPIIYLIEPFL